MSTTPSVLTDISPDHTLLAIHSPLPPSSAAVSNKRRITVQIRDARTGITKYTLSCSPDDDNDDEDVSTIRRLYFASNTHLCALSGQTVLLWDLNRGVISHTISPAKKHVVHSLVTIPRIGGNEEEADGKGSSTVLVLCEKVKDGNKLYLFEYDVLSGKLVRKIKSGSRDTTTDDDGNKGGVVDVDVSNNGKLMVVWNGSTNHIRLMDGSTGDKIDRIKVKDHDIVPSSMRKVMNLTNDGKVLCVQTNIGLCLYEISNDDNKLIGKIQIDKTIPSASCFRDDDGHYTISIQTDDDNMVQLYHLDLAKGGKKHVLKPITKISSSSTQQQSLSSVHFYQDKLKIISLSGGVGSGSKTVEVHDVNYRDKVSNELIVGEIKVGNKEQEEEKKKRKVDKVYKTGVVMGPSESGKEIMPNLVEPLGANKKKARKMLKDDDDDDMDAELVIEDEEGDAPTIGERLKRLTAELDKDDDDTDDSDLDDDVQKRRKQNKISPFNNKTNPATTESLTTLIQQALNSNDDTMLELALNVGDKRVIESTVMSLTTTTSENDEDEGMGMVLLTKLLTKLSTKLSKTPSRSEQLSVWIRFVLIAFTTTNKGNNNTEEEEEIRNILEALRNLLNERVESLPHLLRLEGRLALLGGTSAGY